MIKIIKYIITLTIMFNVSINMTFASEIENVNSRNIKQITEKNINNQQSKFADSFNYSEIEGDDADINCNALFGSKDDPKSIRSIVDDIMQAGRILVPILAIALGTIDFFRAVVANKEEDIKKAQKRFVKRLIWGVAFFFSPIIIDIIMSVADMAWEGLGYGCK